MIFCPFCRANHYENLENPKSKLETEFASRSMTYPSGRILSHSLQKRFSKLLQFLPENLQHTQKRMNKMRLTAVNFIRKSWSKSFSTGIFYNRVGLECICATILREYTELFYIVANRATDCGRSMGGCNFRNFLSISVPKCYGGKI